MENSIQITLTSMKEEQNSKLDALQENIVTLRDQLDGMINSNALLQKAFENATVTNNQIKQSYNTAIQEVSAAHTKISLLEDRIEELERRQRSTMIEIRNVPLEEKENVDEIVSRVHKALDLTVAAENIRQAYKKKSGNNNMIIVEYQTIKTRFNVLKALKKFNKNNKQEKFNSKTL
ncbi:hypothetical protein PYW07_015067 [Mythimna separata]|uniref:Uncharacterized protein n=1 Tax=Mythimna separata TaxID=271217 RepID=A0AAD8DY92_MYTSE|nr:hypothetical protein PYW07_015067 [Mythimna separata]